MTTIAHRDFGAPPPDGFIDWSKNSFDGYACCFPPHGAPGITEEWRVWDGYETAILTYRDRFGRLLGLHCYHARKVGDVPEDAKHYFPGYTMTLVSPHARRQGVGTALLLESVRRFNTDLDQQTYTESGYALAKRVRALLCRNPSHAALNAAKAGSAMQNRNAQSVLSLVGAA